MQHSSVNKVTSCGLGMWILFIKKKRSRHVKEIARSLSYSRSLCLWLPQTNLSWPVRMICGNPTGRFTHSMPCPCRKHAVPLPCRAATGLECVFPIWFTQCGRVWFTLAMPCSDHAVLLKATTQHVRRETACGLPARFRPLPASTRISTKVVTRLRCRWPVWNQTRFVVDERKRGSSTLQKRWSVTLLD